MKRREFMTLVGGAVGTWPLAARAAAKEAGADEAEKGAERAFKSVVKPKQKAK